jgi:hypothetical protein
LCLARIYQAANPWNDAPRSHRHHISCTHTQAIIMRFALPVVPLLLTLACHLRLCFAHTAENLFLADASVQTISEHSDWPEVTPRDQAYGLSLQGSARDSFSPIVQPLVFHVIYMADGTGFVPYSALVQQVAELNDAFSAAEAQSANYAGATDSRIRFTLHAVDYRMNDTENQLCPLFNWQPIVKQKYYLDPAQYLNVYICQVQANLGLSWIPYQAYQGKQLPENHWMLGTMLYYDLLPGNKVLGGRWSAGKILVHEVGHSMGLQHIYQGDCYGTEANSDGIADTPRQSGNPSQSCAAGKGTDSCPTLPGLDDIQNYMGIYYDSCRTHFTPGQVQYMHNIIQTLKPTLVQQLPSGCVSAIDPTDASPDLMACIGPVVTDATHSSAPRAWCKTDKYDSSRWGWACCPLASGQPDMTCRTGAFSLSDVPVGGALPKRPKGADQQINATVLSPTGAPSAHSTCVYAGCQLPFTINNIVYGKPITAQVYRPFRSRALKGTELWCPKKGYKVYSKTSPAVKHQWMKAAC